MGTITRTPDSDPLPVWFGPEPLPPPALTLTPETLLSPLGMETKALWARKDFGHPLHFPHFPASPRPVLYKGETLPMYLPPKSWPAFDPWQEWITGLYQISHPGLNVFGLLAHQNPGWDPTGSPPEGHTVRQIQWATVHHPVLLVSQNIWDALIADQPIWQPLIPTDFTAFHEIYSPFPLAREPAEPPD